MRVRTNITSLIAAILITNVVPSLFAQIETRETGQSSRRIIVSIPDRKLAVLEGGEVIKVYQTAVGAARTPSPIGEFTIVNRITNPTYYSPGKVVQPGKSNPLGTRWMGLSIKGFGIHGTNVPGSIGKAASHGCIRLRNSDVEELFELLSVGDVVELCDETDQRLAVLFGSEEKRKPEELMERAERETKSMLVLAAAVATR